MDVTVEVSPGGKEAPPPIESFEDMNLVGSREPIEGFFFVFFVLAHTYFFVERKTKTNGNQKNDEERESSSVCVRGISTHEHGETSVHPLSTCILPAQLFVSNRLLRRDGFYSILNPQRVLTGDLIWLTPVANSTRRMRRSCWTLNSTNTTSPRRFRRKPSPSSAPVTTCWAAPRRAPARRRRFPSP